MKPAHIKAGIAAAETTQQAIADHLGVSVQAVGRVVSGSMRSARIEAELSRIVGKPIHTTKSTPGRKKSVWKGVEA
jgi:hypothetical protein